MSFFQECLSKSKNKKEALKLYLRKVVIFQSTNKKNMNWNEKRRASIDMTYRQIKDRTGVSLGLIHQVISEMRESGEIEVFRTKRSGFKNPMIFYYFVDIFEAMIKKISHKVVGNLIKISKKMNTRNIYYINKLIYKRILKEKRKMQLDDFYQIWNFEKMKWERNQKSNFKYADNERKNIFKKIFAILE